MTLRMTVTRMIRLGGAMFSISCATEPAEEEPNIEQSYAGLTAEDEEPLFGETAIFEAIGEDAEDPLMADAEVLGRSGYDVAILWGQLRPNLDAGEIVDWSGSVQIDEGRLHVLRTIRFDLGDRVLATLDPSRAAFLSHTRPHHDGLLLRVEAAEGAIMTLDSAAYTGEFELREGVTVVSVDDAGNRVAVAVSMRAPNACARGIMGGRWHEIDARGIQGGFRGRWHKAGGELHGVMRGVYGVRRSGEQVFFGKVIVPTGEMIGLLAGRYGDGQFHGRYLGRELDARGAVHGRYIEALPGDERGGFFLGTWREYCEGEGPSADEPSIE